MLHPPSIQALAPAAAADEERSRRTPVVLRGKPFRRLQREFYQRWYRYPHRNLLVVSLPKSGSTWVLRMLVETPGYVAWNPPNIKWYCHDLLPGSLDPAPAGYTVTKTHTPPTEENLRVVAALGRPYLVTIRDLRDVCVSWAFYARNRTHSPPYGELKGFDVSAAIDYFIERVLPGYREWCLGWLRRRNAKQGLLLKYEDLLVDPEGQMRRAFEHVGLPTPDDRLREIVEKHSFQKATGRKPGQEDNRAFNRKGVAGDWANHLSPAQRSRFKSIAGEALIELGYTAGADW